MPSLIFRKGLDLKEAVAGELTAAYHSQIVEDVRAAGFTRQTGRLTLHLAQEFGFCYGVDRAVDYAYQTRRKFPDRRVFLTGEIIHNPHVNDRLRAQGIRILTDPGEDRRALGPEDVVILPAFGVSIGELAALDQQGCTLVDTTCGSVLNVWKNVRRYAQEGFTAVIHGKVHHEETRATASQATQYPNGHYLIVRDEAEAAIACDFIRQGGSDEAFIARFGEAVSAGFAPVARPRPHRLRQPDDDADERVVEDRRDVPRRDGRPLRRGGAGRSASAPSTRSAAPPRSVRTRSSRCSTHTRSTSRS